METAAVYSDDGDVIDVALRVFAELERHGQSENKTVMHTINVPLKTRRSEYRAQVHRPTCGIGLRATPISLKLAPRCLARGASAPKATKPNASASTCSGCGSQAPPLL